MPEERNKVTAKERALEVLRELPDDARIEDAIEQLYLLHKIELGIAQADAGQKIPHAEARERIRPHQ
jgi:hypothetical protein